MLAGVDEAAVEVGRLRSCLGAACDPLMCRIELGTAQQQHVRPPALDPALGQFGDARMFADPGRVDGERGRELLERARKTLATVEEDVVEPAERGGRLAVGHLDQHHRDDALAEALCGLHLPGALLRGDRARGHHEHDGVGRREQPLEPLLPILAGRDIVAVEERVEPGDVQRVHQLFGEHGAVAARVGNEDFERLVGLGHLEFQ